MNAVIETNLSSAQMIVETGNKYASDIYEKTPYHLGEIYMYLDPDLKGEVQLTYVESTKNNAEVVKVVLDTKKNEIVSAGSVGTDSKLDPGTLDYSSWKVDSDKAIELALHEVNNIQDFTYDKVLIFSNNMYVKGDAWVVHFINLDKNVYFWCMINPYDGSIYSSGVRKAP